MQNQATETTPRIFAKSFAGIAVGSLPLLALLLVPQLMRSRAGSIGLLTIGIVLLVLMLAALAYLAPRLSAWTAPAGTEWTHSTATSSTRRVWRTRTRSALGAALGGVAVYLAGQFAAYAFAWVFPYVTEVLDESGDIVGWNLHYLPYALQALIVFTTTCLALARYAWGVRRLAAVLSPS